MTLEDLIKRRRIRAGLVAGCAVVSLLVLSLMAGCFNDRLEPVAPTWDVDLTLPLANRFYTISDVVNRDPDLLRAGVGNEVIYSNEFDVAPTTIGDRISINPSPSRHRVRIGAFTLSPFSLNGSFDLPWLPRGNVPFVPDTTVSVPDQHDTVTTFISATLESGSIRITVRNNLPVAVGIVNDILLLDGGGEVARFRLAGAVLSAGGGTASASDDLSGKTVDHVVRLSGVQLHVVGSPVPVTIPTGSLLTTTLDVTNLRARRALIAEIPPQRLTDNDTAYLALNDSTVIKEVLLKSGSFTLTFTSAIPLDVTLRYHFTEVQRQVGGGYADYEDSLFLPRLGVASRTVNLTGTRVRSRDSGLLRSLQTVTSLWVPGTSVPVTLDRDDSVGVRFSPQATIIADSAVGVIKPTWVNVSSGFKVNFGELPTKFSGQWYIPWADLALKVSSGIGFPLDLHVRLSARNASTGQVEYLDIPATEQRITTGNDTVRFDPVEVGTFLTRFSGRFPDSILINGAVLVNPPDRYDTTLNGVGTIGSRSSVGETARLEIPLRLGITGGTYADTVVMGDTSGSGYKSYSINKDQIRDVNSGTMYIEVQNGMPVQLGVNVQLLDRSRQPLLQVPQSGANPVFINPAAVDANGDVTVPARSTCVIQLSQQDVRQFDPAEFLSQAITLATTPGSPAVRFRTSDYMRIRIWTTLSYRVNR